MTNRAGRVHRSLFASSLGFACSLALASAPAAQAGRVLSEQKISEIAGGFGGVLDLVDRFGSSTAGLGDIDGDGVGDLAVGAPNDDDGGSNQGAVWILFMNADGTVANQRKISETEGGFGGVLDPDDNFGDSITALGDLDGNGVGDLAVGATGDDWVFDEGAVWILFMNAGGTVASAQKISETTGGLGGHLYISDWFGTSVAALGDLDGDGNEDIAVGASGTDGAGLDEGAVWILFLNSDGTVASERKIGPALALSTSDHFGISVAGLGDLDCDEHEDLAVGATGDDDGGIGNQGAVWILFLDPDGRVGSYQKISATRGGFGGHLDPGDWFGGSIAALGDVDGDEVGDLAVGAAGEDDGGLGQGAVWILFMNSVGTVAYETRIAEDSGGFGGVLHPYDSFGWSVAALGDLDGDEIGELAVGAYHDDDGGDAQGAVWTLFLDGPRPPPRRFAPGLAPPILPLSTHEGPVVRFGPPIGERQGTEPPRSTALDSSGHLAGVDDSVDCPRLAATARVRNGSNLDECGFISLSAPLAGEDWRAWVDVSLYRDARASLILVSDRALEGTPTPFGELLIDVLTRPPLYTSSVVHSGATDRHGITIPSELVGRSFSLQAVLLTDRGGTLTNAIDLVVEE